MKTHASVLILLLCGRAIGDEKAPEAKDGWQRLFREQAAGYRVDVGDAGEAQLIDQPVMQWAHPVRGGEHGAIFLWLKDGLPVTIGTLNIWPLDDGRQRVAHELHSLSQLPLTASWRTRRWTPPPNSLDWKPLASTAAVPLGREQRQRRMRQLADQFSAHSRDGNQREWALRLLPRPLYRYEPAPDGARPPRRVVDGAIFGFMEGTDLEVVLLIELRPAADGERWWYAAARMSDYSLELIHDGRMAWQVGPGEYDRSTAPYYCSTVETRESHEHE